jgi:DNA polymerase-2
MDYQGFILSNRQIIQKNATQLIFQGRLSDGMRFHWTVTRPGLVFFLDRDKSCTSPGAFRKSVELRSLRGQPVDALYFHTTAELTRARRACESRGIPTYEADVNLVARFLMERFIKGGVTFESNPVNVENNTVYFIDPKVKSSNFTPKLKLLSIDIECSMEMDLYSIAINGKNLATVLVVDPDHRDKTRAYHSFRNEQELLYAFFRIVREYDPDAFIGWNLIGFDLQWLSRKCTALGIKFNIGTDGPAELLAPGTLFNQWTARILETQKAPPTIPKKKAVAKKPVKKTVGAKQPTAVDAVFGTIKRSKKGVNIASIKQKTGYDNKKIHNLVYKLKKQGKIKSPIKGVYVKV